MFDHNKVLQDLVQKATKNKNNLKVICKDRDDQSFYKDYFIENLYFDCTVKITEDSFYLHVSILSNSPYIIDNVIFKFLVDKKQNQLINIIQSKRQEMSDQIYQSAIYCNGLQHFLIEGKND